MSLLELFREFDSDSSACKQLEAEVCSTEASFAQAVPEIADNRDGDMRIGRLVELYMKGADNPLTGYERSTAVANVNQLCKVMRVGLELKYTEANSLDEIKEALFERPISDLTAKMVYKFQELSLGSDHKQLDKDKRLKLHNTINSYLRQAKSLFSSNAMDYYQRSEVEVLLPEGFMKTKHLPVSEAEYTLPDFQYIKGIFLELPKFRKENPDIYLILMLALFVGLRPDEIKYLRKEKIQFSGYWKVRIEVTPDFKPKGYHIRSIKIPDQLGEHLLDVCGDNGSIFVLSGHKTNRIKYLFGKINPHLRKNFLDEIHKPTYELRKFFASGCNIALGMDETHQKMGHKSDSTTRKFYVDREAPDALLDLYNEWAQKLFSANAFANKRSNLVIQSEKNS